MILSLRILQHGNTLSKDNIHDNRRSESDPMKKYLDVVYIWSDFSACAIFLSGSIIWTMFLFDVHSMVITWPVVFPCVLDSFTCNYPLWRDVYIWFIFNWCQHKATSMFTSPTFSSGFTTGNKIVKIHVFIRYKIVSSDQIFAIGRISKDNELRGYLG